MRVKKDKCYVVFDKRNKYIQGAFPFSKEGNIDAQNYAKKLTKQSKNTQEFGVREG